MSGARPLFGVGGRAAPNLWDIACFALVIGVLVLIVQGTREAMVPVGVLDTVEIDLSPSALPGYAVRTTLRMFAAITASLLFTLGYATLAAKSRRAEVVLIPLLDILQSVPILGFLTFTVVFFMSLFPGSVMGLELAAVFAIFTGQAWNMTFSFYQSLRTVPRDLDEASRGFHLTSWQRFWRLEVPFGMPGLVWNAMMSMSGGWFFVVASEAITVGDKTAKLPGIGAYVATALEARDILAVLYAIIAMLVVIILYDQLLFRPLVAWAEKFRFEQTASATLRDPWVLRAFRRTRLLRRLFRPLGRLASTIGRLPIGMPAIARARRARPGVSRGVDFAWYAVVAAGAAWAAWQVAAYISTELGWSDVLAALGLGCLTLFRVSVLMLLATLLWVPVGVWIGLRPALALRLQPLAQFLAAFPANLFFPVFVVLIVRFQLNPDVWLSPLMILGTQWYLLFNVIAGASVFPGDLKEAAAVFHVRGWRWWRQVILPGVFPYFVTGGITASGGAWNASIVAEVAAWGDTKLAAHGLGAFIAQATEASDYPRVVLGVAVMSLFVIAFNRLLWRPLYAYAGRRLRFD